MEPVEAEKSTENVPKGDSGPRFYYVYEHMKPGTIEVFYVGKGTWTEKSKFRRASDPHSHNPFWTRIVEKYGKPDAEIVSTFESENDAFDEEHLLVQIYGRRNNQTGVLCNLTEGGKGGSGHRVSFETRQRISKSNTGKKRSADARERMSDIANKRLARAPHPRQGNKYVFRGRQLTLFSSEVGRTWDGARKENFSKARKGIGIKGCGVIDTKTGKIYASVSEAARAIGRNSAGLSRILRGERRNPTSLVLLKDWQQSTLSPSPQEPSQQRTPPGTMTQDSALLPLEKQMAEVLTVTE